MASHNLQNVTCVKSIFVWENRQLFVRPEVLLHADGTVNRRDNRKKKLLRRSKLAFCYYRKEFGSFKDKL